MDPSDPEDLDPYAYASDNPSTGEDPSGQAGCLGDVCGSVQLLEHQPGGGGGGSGDGDGGGRAPGDSDGTGGGYGSYGGYGSGSDGGGDGMLEGHLGIEPTGPTAGLYREMTRPYRGGLRSFLGGIGDSLVSLLDAATMAGDPGQGVEDMLTGNTYSARYTQWLARHGVQTGANSEYGAGIGTGSLLQVAAGASLGAAEGAAAGADATEDTTAADLPGYSSFRAAKADLGSAGPGNVYDHVVEQSQIARSGLSPEEIHNPFNLDPVPSEVNQLKANYYSSKQFFTNGGTVRDWLTGQSFADQYEFGMDVLMRIQNGMPLP